MLRSNGMREDRATGIAGGVLVIDAARAIVALAS